MHLPISEKEKKASPIEGHYFQMYCARIPLIRVYEYNTLAEHMFWYYRPRPPDASQSTLARLPCQDVDKASRSAAMCTWALTSATWQLASTWQMEMSFFSIACSGEKCPPISSSPAHLGRPLNLPAESSSSSVLSMAPPRASWAMLLMLHKWPAVGEQRERERAP